jgi:hypothetical protein
MSKMEASGMARTVTVSCISQEAMKSRAKCLGDMLRTVIGGREMGRRRRD